MGESFTQAAIEEVRVLLSSASAARTAPAQHAAVPIWASEHREAVAHNRRRRWLDSERWHQLMGGCREALSWAASARRTGGTTRRVMMPSWKEVAVLDEPLRAYEQRRLDRSAQRGRGASSGGTRSERVPSGSEDVEERRAREGSDQGS